MLAIALVVAAFISISSIYQFVISNITLLLIIYGVAFLTAFLYSSYLIGRRVLDWLVSRE
jgi:hypothetical protein